MPAAGSKGAPKKPGELKDDTSSSREEKQVSFFSLATIMLTLFVQFMFVPSLLYVYC